ncbi:MAG: M48 family metalloprotease [Deltaproteobacteria bacterium]|nr:M48 family metalloprotease [Deltaproteobacteria bacterium]
MDLHRIRYRGDKEDVDLLFRDYNLEGIISTSEERQKLEESNFRNQLLKDGAFLLSQPISPRIFNIVSETKQKLGLEGEYEVFCLNSNSINAFAYVQPAEEKNFFIIGITSEALEELEDLEIQFILGHELGHFLFEHNRMNYLINPNPTSQGVTLLPSMGENIFLRWRKKCEISTDRIGLLACGDFENAARAMLKTAYGLTGKNLNLDVDSLLQQIDALKETPEALEVNYRSHPLMPLRLKVMQMFAESPIFKQVISGKSDFSEKELNALEDQTDQWVNWIKRYPRRPLDLAAMKLVTAAGLKLIMTEAVIMDEEIKIIIQILHKYFTDEPGDAINEIMQDTENIDNLIRTNVKEISEKGDDRHKTFVLSRLADIAIADGKLAKPEAGIIFDIAKDFGIQEKAAYSIVVGGMSSMGLNIDWKMNSLVREIKAQLQKKYVV